MTASTHTPAPLRLLAVHAHPDDESSKGAATMAMYAAAGVEVMVATCTDGSRGDIQNPAVEREPHPKRDMAGARRLEMDQAAKVLGIQQRWLGFTDSGLPEGDPLPPLPAGSFAVQPLERAAAPLVRLVRDFKPQVIVSYDENGGYPHPDHIMAHRVAVEAFAAAVTRTGIRTPERPGNPASSTTTGPSARTGSAHCILPWRKQACSPRTPSGLPRGWKRTRRAIPRRGVPMPPPRRSTAGTFLRPATTPSARTERRWIRWGSSLPCRPRCSAVCGRGKTTP